MERRYTTACTISLENRGDGKLPAIAGLASVFYRASDSGTEFELFAGENDDDYRCVERIMPTAFDEVLRRGDDVLALHNHNPDRLLGRVANGTLHLEKTPDGLRYRITPPDCEMAREVVESIRRGDLRGSSFSFDCRGNGCRFIRQGKEMIREIHSVSKCGDVGPVASPAYSSTTTDVRAATDFAEARRTLQEWLRSQSGMSPAMRDAMESRMRLVMLGL